MGEGWIETEGSIRRQTIRTEVSFEKDKKKFVRLESFTTFAVPNKTGVRWRMSVGRINKIETMIDWAEGMD